MGSILAKTIVDRVARHLSDEGAQRFWTREELLAFLNQGQRAICLAMPDAYSDTATSQLAAGVKQGVPTGALRILDVGCNMGAAGTARGRVIRFCEREYLDQINPDWMAATPDGVVRHWTRDERDPDVWFCSPPQPAAGMHYVEMLVAKVPPDATINGVGDSSTDAAIALDDIYEPSLFWYVLAEALMKESDAQLPAKGQHYWNRFLQSVGLKGAKDVQFGPKKQEEPGIGKPPRETL